MYLLLVVLAGHYLIQSFFTDAVAVIKDVRIFFCTDFALAAPEQTLPKHAALNSIIQSVTRNAVLSLSKR